MRGHVIHSGDSLRNRRPRYPRPAYRRPPSRPIQREFPAEDPEEWPVDLSDEPSETEDLSEDEPETADLPEEQPEAGGTHDGRP